MIKDLDKFYAVNGEEYRLNSGDLNMFEELVNYRKFRLGLERANVNRFEHMDIDELIEKHRAEWSE